MIRFKDILDWSRNEKKNALFMPLFVVMMLDMTMTILRQPQNYWSGVSGPSELNPIGSWLLTQNPLLFVYFFMAYLLVTYVSLLVMKPVLRIPLFMVLFINHTGEAVGWMKKIIEFSVKELPKENFPEEILVFTIEVIIFSLLSIWAGRSIAKNLEKP